MTAYLDLKRKERKKEGRKEEGGKKETLGEKRFILLTIPDDSPSLQELETAVHTTCPVMRRKK